MNINEKRTYQAVYTFTVDAEDASIFGGDWDTAAGDVLDSLLADDRLPRPAITQVVPSDIGLPESMTRDEAYVQGWSDAESAKAANR